VLFTPLLWAVHNPTQGGRHTQAAAAAAANWNGSHASQYPLVWACCSGPDAVKTVERLQSKKLWEFQQKKKKLWWPIPSNLRKSRWVNYTVFLVQIPENPSVSFLVFWV
jgi:hypothetical protein